MLLEDDGYVVEEAESGPQALAMFEPGKFDMVFTDYCMPDMRGDQLAAAIKKGFTQAGRGDDHRLSGKTDLFKRPPGRG